MKGLLGSGAVGAPGPASGPQAARAAEEAPVVARGSQSPASALESFSLDERTRVTSRKMASASPGRIPGTRSYSSVRLPASVRTTASPPRSSSGRGRGPWRRARRPLAAERAQRHLEGGVRRLVGVLAAPLVVDDRQPVARVVEDGARQPLAPGEGLLRRARVERGGEDVGHRLGEVRPPRPRRRGGPCRPGRARRGSARRRGRGRRGRSRRRSPRGAGRRRGVAGTWESSTIALRLQARPASEPSSGSSRSRARASSPVSGPTRKAWPVGASQAPISSPRPLEPRLVPASRTSVTSGSPSASWLSRASAAAWRSWARSLAGVSWAAGTDRCGLLVQRAPD